MLPNVQMLLQAAEGAAYSSVHCAAIFCGSNVAMQERQALLLVALVCCRAASCLQN
jgi:hypothetical protein